MTYEVKLVEASVNKQGKYLITMELMYPRMIHAEFMTHRVFSRNASSNRAIPTEKLLEQVSNDPAMPVYWGKNMAGMQAKEAMESLVNDKMPWDAWRLNARDACKKAAAFAKAGYHKQIVNRIIEPYQHIKVIVTSTEWENFFQLRCNEAAQPEIRELAERMEKVYLEVLGSGDEPFFLNKLEQPFEDWHLPYVSLDEKKELDINTQIKCSVARCARVSYLNHDKSEPSVEKDIKLYELLAKEKHMSPFEHQATCFPEYLLENNFRKFHKNEYRQHGVTHCSIDDKLWSGNFREFAQYRQIFDYQSFINNSKEINTETKGFDLNNVF